MKIVVATITAVALMSVASASAETTPATTPAIAYSTGDGVVNESLYQEAGFHRRYSGYRSHRGFRGGRGFHRSRGYYGHSRRGFYGGSYYGRHGFHRRGLHDRRFVGKRGFRHHGHGKLIIKKGH